MKAKGVEGGGSFTVFLLFCTTRNGASAARWCPLSAASSPAVRGLLVWSVVDPPSIDCQVLRSFLRRCIVTNGSRGT